MEKLMARRDALMYSICMCVKVVVKDHSRLELDYRPMFNSFNRLGTS